MGAPPALAAMGLSGLVLLVTDCRMHVGRRRDKGNESLFVGNEAAERAVTHIGTRWQMISKWYNARTQCMFTVER